MKTLQDQPAVPVPLAPAFLHTLHTYIGSCQRLRCVPQHADLARLHVAIIVIEHKPLLSSRASVGLIFTLIIKLDECCWHLLTNIYFLDVVFASIRRGYFTISQLKLSPQHFCALLVLLIGRL
jgi:hypothetical protein